MDGCNLTGADFKKAQLYKCDLKYDLVDCCAHLFASSHTLEPALLALQRSLLAECRLDACEPPRCKPQGCQLAGCQPSGRCTSKQNCRARFPLAGLLTVAVAMPPPLLSPILAPHHSVTLPSLRFVLPPCPHAENHPDRCGPQRVQLGGCQPARCQPGGRQVPGCKLPTRKPPGRESLERVLGRRRPFISGTEGR